MSNQNNGNQNGNNLPANGQPEKKGLKAFLDGLRRKYDAVRYSKTGKWIMRGLTVATCAGTAKMAYDKGVAQGKASVTPTIVTIEKIPETETPVEEPAKEESAVEAE